MFEIFENSKNNGYYPKFNSLCINLIVAVLILCRDMTETKGSHFFFFFFFF